MTNLDPVLGKKLIGGTLARIKQSNPDYYRFVAAELSKLDKDTDWNSLSGVMDAIGSIASNFGNVLTKAGTAYADILVNRENAKTAQIVANAQVKAQIDAMNNDLKLQQAQSNSAYTRSQLQQQQQALYDTGNKMTSGGGSSTMLWISLGVIVLAGGYFLMNHKKAA